ncbi:NADH:quinone oxidoreductase [Paragemmobacter straminiformis]|uniref:NADH:quinone oxidoreductase n=1 Tax=Paragemmobacter straminiformis TaxID=2045119 RepID=A0A842IAT0_9RHOB|nr:NADH:quinone oxidoreductase [Gemmobacter straminiformis]MBC2836775.1 NADH:quinone oxidoreductase [Gemmobacter straminiformis]
MKRVENLNAPSATGWILAVAAGLLAFAVARVVGGFDYTPSGFFGVLVMVAAGLVLGMPWGGAVPGAGEVADDAEPAKAEPAKAEAAAAPAVKVAEAVAAPAAAVAAPAAAVTPDAAPKAAAAKAAAPKAAPKAAAKPAAAAKKAEAAPKVDAAPAGGKKPAALKAPRKGKADDLKQIEGIGPALEKLANELGIYHFDQIAAWGEAEVAWMDTNLKGFKGRVTRDKWVAQAKLIGEVGMDEFLRRAKTNDY